uniref:Transmembrane protein 184A n=1 Tax=Toxoplasma gondii (strain ATCC 50861 / VEG) TaxID=432359 RepID=A0A0F7V139_TOXGV|nr:TPA: Transmembrane protein 184A [Toxoplasma gondii VEG]
MDDPSLLEAPALDRGTPLSSPAVSHSAFIDVGWVSALGSVCALVASLLSGISIFLHLAHYAFPSLQKYVVRILLFVPVYAVSSLVILFMPSQFVYIEALRDMWEAVVVYSFFCLILARCGGEDACAGALSRDPGSVRHPQPVPFLLRLWKKILRLPPTEAAALTPPAGRCFGPEAPTHATARPTSSDKSAQRERRTAGETNFYVREPSRREVYGRQTRRHSGAACCFGEDSMFLCREDLPTDLAFVKCCKRWILQFIFVKPTMALVSLIMFSVGKYHSFCFQVPYMIIYNISICGALYALGLFYLATRKLPALLQFHPVAKFLAMKLVIVATWYQAFFLGIIDGMTVRDVTKWTNWLLCVEMPLFALLNAYAYPVVEFLPGAGARETTVSYEGHFQSSDSGSSAVGKSSSTVDGSGLDKNRSMLVHQGVAVGDVARCEDSSGKQGGQAGKKLENSASTSSSAFSEVGGAVAAAASKIDATLHVAATTIGRPFHGISCVADPAAREVALRNVKDAVLMSDVVTDAYYNFHAKYNQHALLINEPPFASEPGSRGSSAPAVCSDERKEQFFFPPKTGEEAADGFPSAERAAETPSSVPHSRTE